MYVWNIVWWTLDDSTATFAVTDTNLNRACKDTRIPAKLDRDRGISSVCSFRYFAAVRQHEKRTHG